MTVQKNVREGWITPDVAHVRLCPQPAGSHELTVQDGSSSRFVTAGALALTMLALTTALHYEGLRRLARWAGGPWFPARPSSLMQNSFDGVTQIHPPVEWPTSDSLLLGYGSRAPENA